MKNKQARGFTAQPYTSGDNPTHAYIRCMCEEDAEESWRDKDEIRRANVNKSGSHPELPTLPQEHTCTRSCENTHCKSNAQTDSVFNH